MAGHHPDKCQ